MHKIFTLLILLWTSCLGFAQIPNASFEDWSPQNNYETPDLWNTNQDTLYQRVTKDSINVDGDYSIKLSSNSPSAWVDCTSTAFVTTKLDEPIGEGQNLSFYLKCQPDDDQEDFVHFNFRARYFITGDFKDEYVYTATQIYNEFTLIELPNIPVGVDSMSIYLLSGAINGSDDGCYNYTTSWVDAIKLKDRTSTNDLEYNSLVVYPNPSSGLFHVSQSDDEYDMFKVLDLLGREIMTGSLSKTQINITTKGPYFLQLFSKEAKERDIVRKIVVK